jgi:hypothetical protein
MDPLSNAVVLGALGLPVTDDLPRPARLAGLLLELTLKGDPFLFDFMKTLQGVINSILDIYARKLSELSDDKDEYYDVLCSFFSMETDLEKISDPDLSLEDFKNLVKALADRLLQEE